jgi:hypothetical protein
MNQVEPPNIYEITETTRNIYETIETMILLSTTSKLYETIKTTILILKQLKPLVNSWNINRMKMI